MDNKLCSVCGSDRTIPDAILSTFGPPQIQLQRTGGSIFNRFYASQPLGARVCGDCGHVAFFVPYPDRLFRAYERNEPT